MKVKVTTMICGNLCLPNLNLRTYTFRSPLTQTPM